MKDTPKTSNASSPQDRLKGNKGPPEKNTPTEENLQTKTVQSNWDTTNSPAQPNSSATSNLNNGCIQGLSEEQLNRTWPLKASNLSSTTTPPTSKKDNPSQQPSTNTSQSQSNPMYNQPPSGASASTQEIRSSTNNNSTHANSQSSNPSGTRDRPGNLGANSGTTRQDSTMATDKIITLKRGNRRQHIQQYTLRIKISTPKSEDEEQQFITKELTNFTSIVLRADEHSIIPPFLELDRNDRNTPDLSTDFGVNDLDSFSLLKKYFFRISPRRSDGSIWCSMILARNLPFSVFMDKARSSLENMSFSLWPKASDHESATDVGWLLYSCRYQDEERIAELLSKLTGEHIGAKWRPIRTTNGTARVRSKEDDSEKTYAIHLECSSDRAQLARGKLQNWYGSSSLNFPDGTKMRLVPPFNTILSSSNRSKYASLIARQSSLLACLGVGSTWEFSTNLVLDRPHPVSQITLRQHLMDIKSMAFPGKPLFHCLDRQWRSETGVSFCFCPENEADARSVIAGLVPMFQDNYSAWYSNLFQPTQNYDIPPRDGTQPPDRFFLKKSQLYQTYLLMMMRSTIQTSQRPLKPVRRQISK
jgi:hypothetical protein